MHLKTKKIIVNKFKIIYDRVKWKKEEKKRFNNKDLNRHLK